MNNKIIFGLGLISTLALSGCQNFFNHVDRAVLQNSLGNYHITQALPPNRVDEYWLHNVKVTQEEGTDGVFLFIDGAMLELTGTLSIVRLEHDFEGPNRLPENLLKPPTLKVGN